MINKFHKKTLSLFIKETDDNQQNRAKYGNFAGWNSIVINLFLFIIKIITGIMINSLALIADSIHSISDTATSIIVIVGFKISGKPADKKHPFGHQRAEYIATLIISVILIVAGIEFIKEGIVRFSNPQEVQFSTPILFLIISTMLIKFWMGSLTKYIGNKIDSQSIKADAIHHYTDVISTVFVFISVYLGKFGLFYFDGIGSMLVGLILIYTGFTIAIEASDLILGTAPSDKFIKTIKKLSNSIVGVIDTHDIIIHNYGDKKFISLHIEINCKIDSGTSHDISKNVENILTNYLNAHITVHIDPIELDNPLLKRISAELSTFQDTHKYLKNFHDLRLNHEHNLVIFDIVLDCENKNELEYKNKIEKTLTSKFKSEKFEIHVDPIFMNN